MKKITTAVLPVAGMGTRFLPVTKASPKEMLPIIDRPLIQYIVDEVAASGIENLVLVTSYTKRAIEDYFDSNYELEQRLAERGKQELLARVHEVVPKNLNIAYVRQPEPKGLGHAVLCAERVVGNHPFAVLLADDIIDSSEPCLAGMIARYNQTGGSVLAVEQVDRSRVDQYGIVTLGRESTIAGIVEKPAIDQAPSNLGVIGRYVLTGDVFDKLRSLPPGRGGEIQLTDAIAQLIPNEPVTAYEFSGVRYDCGSKQGFFQATLAYAKKQPELLNVLREFCKEKVSC